MRLMIVASLIVGALIGAPASTAAQERVPTTGTVAAGIDVGAFVPNNDGLSSSMLLNFLYEYYVTPRVSARADFGWSNPSFNGGGVDSLRQMPLRLDVNYNWEGGRWHPFVGTGVGLYFMQFRVNDDTIGDTIGGGGAYVITFSGSLN